MELVLFIISIILVGAVVFLGRLIKPAKEEIAFSTTIVELINALNQGFDWKYSGSLDTICTYVIKAFNVISETSQETDKEKVLELVIEEAKKVTTEAGIEVTPTVLDILTKITKVLVGKYL